jgi:hypothetical protein
MSAPAGGTPFELVEDGAGLALVLDYLTGVARAASKY